MVYKYLDPGRDWDAWCEDHPDEYDYTDEEIEDIAKEYQVSMCCKDRLIHYTNGTTYCWNCKEQCIITISDQYAIDQHSLAEETKLDNLL